MSAGDPGAAPTPLWVFGYGSLVWRPAFPFVERRAGFVEGFARRFWQGSTDHRGVPGAPGRVVTLVPAARERCHGVAYRVPDGEAAEVLRRLDHREQGGYVREQHALALRGDDGATEQRVGGLVYRATPGNPNHLGPATLARIAAQVLASRGPSGENREYVLRLAEALEALGAPDPHVFAVAALVARA